MDLSLGLKIHSKEVERMATGSVTGDSIFINLQERGGKKRHKCALQKNRPDHSWKEGKPFNQVLEIQAAGS